MRHERFPMRGFAIVSALFLIVALAALGVGMLYLSTTQHATSAQDVQGSRALAAARAGSEWMVATIMAAETNGNPPYTCATSNFSFAGFDVAISCTRSSHDEEGNRIHVFNIIATATTGGAPGNLSYIERRVDTVVATCRVGSDSGAPC